MTARRLAIAAGAVAAVATVAAAHAFRPGMLTLVERLPERYVVLWRHPSGLEAASHVRPRLPSGCRRTSDPVAFGEELERWEIDCRDAGLRGATVGADGLARTGADVAVRIEWQSGTPFTTMLRAGADTAVAPRSAPHPDTWIVTTAAAYLRLGIEHIWAGVDHLAFVTGLYLLAATPGLLVWTVTAFTVAHSLSLGLSIFDVVRLPAAPVEAAIALSVLLLAGELARGDTGTLTRRAPWLMAGGFGLVHGLGFAGALREVGIPQGQAAVALAGFNVGVEIGQLTFVVCLAAGAIGLRPLARRWPVLRGVPVYAMGTAAAVWTMARLAAVADAAPSAF